MVADRFGARPVLLAGGALYALGIASLACAATPLQIHLAAGVLAGLGMGGASYITVLSALGRAMPEARRSWALGVAAAAGSLGQFLIVPLVQAVIDLGGWRHGTWAMAAAVLLMLPAAALVRGDRPAATPSAAEPAAPDSAVGAVVGAALRHPSYLLLLAGFFVCGFQLAFITTHFPAYLADRGLGAGAAAWAIAMVGLFNVGGAYLAGVLGGRNGKKDLLAGVYFGRALVILVFLQAPLSGFGVMAFGAAMGLLWLSTAPLTSGLVATFFGTRHMATLFGLVFFSHQLGSFAGVYFGGRLFARTGSYDAMWWWCIGLSVAAGLLHMPIRERTAPAFARRAHG